MVAKSRRVIGFEVGVRVGESSADGLGVGFAHVCGVDADCGLVLLEEVECMWDGMRLIFLGGVLK
jgi:hypothetical protein